MSVIGEIVVEIIGSAVEVAANSRSRRLRWVAYGFMVVVVSLIGLLLFWAHSE